uniref:RNA-directed DNA polymerase, eukaryota n=1 Tax=Tanacetum cinerariifolium TaxID=118510 RepID=A0A6L2LQX4_TANCI|nr:RNA-directed DNA polymerase, eukaryota [Tanacetum cinerariifolium]
MCKMLMEISGFDQKSYTCIVGVDRGSCGCTSSFTDYEQLGRKLLALYKFLLGINLFDGGAYLGSKGWVKLMCASDYRSIIFQASEFVKRLGGGVEMCETYGVKMFIGGCVDMKRECEGEANSEASPQPEVYGLLSSCLLQYFFYKLQLSVCKSMNDRLFNGIRLHGSLSLSHLFYADDALFIREWSDDNLRGIIQILKCFHLASGLHINLNKSQVLGVGVPRATVEAMTVSIGCFAKTLSIGGRLTLLKSVLGASPLYTLSIFKVPKGVLKEMESIQNSFFKGAELSEKKITCVAWDKVLASKKKRGLAFPRLFTLETNRNISVKDKMAVALDFSFRRPVRGGVKRNQFNDLAVIMDTVSLSSTLDRWVCSLSNDGDFYVKDARLSIDDMFLLSHTDSTRWVKGVPNKINIFAWRAQRDCLPTRLNLLRRGVILESTSCPICLAGEDDTSHVFFRCPLAQAVLRRIFRWWEVGIDTAYEIEYDVQSTEDVGIDDDYDEDEDFLVDEENEIVKPDVDVRLFGISMDLPFDNIGVTNLVSDDVLKGENVDVINADGFDSDPGNDDETNDYRRRRIRARCDGKVPVFTMSQGTGPTSQNHRMEAEPSGSSGPTTRSKKRKNTGTNHDSQACSSVLNAHYKWDLFPWVLEIKHCTYKFLSDKIFDQVRVNLDIPVKAVQDQLQRELEYSMLRDYVVELQSTNPNTTVKIAVERNIDPSLPTMVFQSIYVCLGALKLGYRARRRDLLGLDGAFMKEPFLG